MKTFIQKPAAVQRTWHLIDAQDRVLGQIATEIAVKLIGKDKTTFTPHVDSGDYVVVINASKIRVTSNKGQKKMYYHHSSFPGGLKEMTFDEMLAKKPEKIIELAVYNMLPKNRTRQDRMARLKVYATAEHKHESQLGKKAE